MQLPLTLLAVAGPVPGPPGLPLQVGLILGLPVLGFLLNGALALWRPQAKSAVSVIGEIGRAHV